jgi:NADH-quinone oxidoreductase subunit N
VNSTISLYYYLRIVKQMYIEPLPEEDRPLTMSGPVASTIGVTLVATLLFGLVPMVYRAIEAGTASGLR